MISSTYSVFSIVSIYCKLFGPNYPGISTVFSPLLLLELCSRFAASLRWRLLFIHISENPPEPSSNQHAPQTHAKQASAGGPEHHSENLLRIGVALLRIDDRALQQVESLGLPPTRRHGSCSPPAHSRRCDVEETGRLAGGSGFPARLEGPADRLDFFCWRHRYIISRLPKMRNGFFLVDLANLFGNNQGVA